MHHLPLFSIPYAYDKITFKDKKLKLHVLLCDSTSPLNLKLNAAITFQHI